MMKIGRSFRGPSDGKVNLFIWKQKSSSSYRVNEPSKDDSIEKITEDDQDNSSKKRVSKKNTENLMKNGLQKRLSLIGGPAFVDDNLLGSPAFKDRSNRELCIKEESDGNQSS